MATFIVNWNPSKWTMPDDELAGAVEVTADGGEYSEPWSVGVRTGGIGLGDRVVLLRQHIDTGLLARGHFTSQVYPGDHWDGSGRLATYAGIAWTEWLPVEDRLPTEALERELPQVRWRRLQASGVRVPNEAEPALHQLWEDHLGQRGRSPVVLPEEVPPSQTYPEGALKRIEVNRYERNPRARRECLAHHGLQCTVCDFDFAATYGDLGKGNIQVHHLRELADLPDSYRVDPVGDLRPVCANCHAMLHRERPALTPEQLRAHMADSR